MFLVFLNYFDVLMSKIIFKKYIINMHFNTKNYLKSNHNHIVSQPHRVTTIRLPASYVSQTTKSYS
jgi:hypothetical protein